MEGLGDVSSYAAPAWVEFCPLRANDFNYEKAVQFQRTIKEITS